MKLKKTGSWRNGETDENESPFWRTKAKRRMGRAAVRVFVHNFMRLPERSGAGDHEVQEPAIQAAPVPEPEPEPEPEYHVHQNYMAASDGFFRPDEPLRRAESNIINMVSEATILASILQLRHVRALADTYHMAISSEPASVLTLCASQIAHVHTANPIGRECPKPNDGEDYAKIMQALKDGGYDARMSIEGKTEPFVEAGTQGFACLDAARKAVWVEA